MYDLTLPLKIAKLVSSARLPKNYQEAKQALASCDSVDQCGAREPMELAEKVRLFD
jgi:hypothetical protein